MPFAPYTREAVTWWPVFLALLIWEPPEKKKNKTNHTKVNKSERCIFMRRTKILVIRTQGEKFSL